MQEGNFLASLLPLIVLFAIFYFLVIRPQQKQQKQHAAMIAALEKGDKIITSGGLICEVVKPEDDFIKVKLNDDVIVRISRDFVARKIEA
ncbi:MULTISPECIES: preprotein translocase subunit YajC [Campylobacter]|uniref:Sec translocon accessory complex subunit YajC n=1 Tax=Campylobacter suis TaxID=2790657 RepID=A0ABM8Q303_9BACT|nr:preprotein translocase subunit YajC [Campylobacter suis]CAD7287273.1 Sec translocon accessory complex subunit YajC [Campylobacter suis]